MEEAEAEESEVKSDSTPTLQVVESTLRTFQRAGDEATLKSAFEELDDKNLWLLKESFEATLGVSQQPMPPKRKTQATASVLSNQTGELLKHTQSECKKRLPALEERLRQSSSSNELVQDWPLPLLEDLTSRLKADKAKIGEQIQKLRDGQEAISRKRTSADKVLGPGRAAEMELMTLLGARQNQNNALLKALSSLPYPRTPKKGSLELKGHGLTLDDVEDVAQNRVKVVISPEGMANVKKGFEVIMEAPRQGMEVYGLTVGVGWNKDQSVFEIKNGQGSEILSAELLEVSHKFNEIETLAHSAGAGKPMSAEIVRAGMLIRLNAMLTGATGAQPDVARCLADFINHDIIPCIPKTGTIGQADINLASDVGQTMLGKGEVYYQGKKMPAADALAAANVKPVQLVGKDFLSILSTNALTAGSAVLAVKDAERLIQKEIIISALCLEGLNGNVAPILKVTTEASADPFVIEAASLMRASLEGSSVWKSSKTRKMQDSLSYRDTAAIIGECLKGIDRAKKALSLQINRSDDNPFVAIKKSDIELDSGEQVSQYVLAPPAIGAIYPSALFDPRAFTSEVRNLLLSLDDFAEAVVKTAVVFENPELTGLPRYLKASDQDHGLGEILKTALEIRNQIHVFTRPVRSSGISLAGGLEDMETNSGLVMKHLHKTIERFNGLASIHLMFAAQAADMRKDFTLGTQTSALRDAFRKVVPFVDKDRAFKNDIEAGTAFAKKWSPKPAKGKETEITKGRKGR
ncbi:MAG: aromatic amino acid lyase [Pseudomonadota bacterium]